MYWIFNLFFVLKHLIPWFKQRIWKYCCMNLNILQSCSVFFRFQVLFLTLNCPLFNSKLCKIDAVYLNNTEYAILLR